MISLIDYVNARSSRCDTETTFLYVFLQTFFDKLPI